MSADAYGFRIPFPANHHPDTILWAARAYAPKRKLHIRQVVSQATVFVVYDGTIQLFCFDIDEKVPQSEIIDRMNDPMNPPIPESRMSNWTQKS